MSKRFAAAVAAVNQQFKMWSLMVYVIEAGGVGLGRRVAVVDGVNIFEAAMPASSGGSWMDLVDGHG